MPAVKKTSSKSVKSARSASSVKAVKKEVKPVAKAAVKKTEAKVAPVKKVEATLSVALFDQLGREKGLVKLPESVFGAKINNALMAQAVRVYLANQRMGSAKTKTRGQVDGSTRKIYQQKGTGRARHGGIRAPIFVGGGIAHGPRTKDFSLNLSAKMRKASVLSALSLIAKEGKVKVIAGFATLDGKTKPVAKAFLEMGLKKTLLVLPEHLEKVFRASRNIDRVTVRQASLLNTYDVLNSGTLVLMQEALPVLEKMLEKSLKEVKETK